MKSRKSQPATTRIASSVGAANQPVQPKARAKADLVVSTRTKEFKRTPPNQAGPLERKKAFRILKRLATNPIREDQAPTEGYQKILENIAWAVIPDFDFAVSLYRLTPLLLSKLSCSVLFKLSLSSYSPNSLSWYSPHSLSPYSPNSL